MSRLSQLLFAAAIAALPATAHGQTPDRLDKILASGVLRVGTTMDTPVFSMRDPTTGNLHGLDMDLLETLSSSLGVKLEYVKMTFGSMLADLAARSPPPTDCGSRSSPPRAGRCRRPTTSARRRCAP